MDSIDQHRQKFNLKVQEFQEQKGKNSCMLTKEHYVATVSRLKQLEKPGEQRTLTDNNLMRRFALLHVESGNNIIEKLVNQELVTFLLQLKNCSTKFMMHILKKVTQGEILGWIKILAHFFIVFLLSV